MKIVTNVQRPGAPSKASAPSPACKAKQVHPDRRSMLRIALASAGLQALFPHGAQAGWDGPAKFLKARQQANMGKLLAPLEVAALRLKDAKTAVVGSDPNYALALETVRRASCNCYTFEAFENDSIETKASLITQNLKLADPCTFRIIVKNTTLLMDGNSPLRIETWNTLDELIRSYTKLDSALIQAGELDSETKWEVVPLLDQTMDLCDKLKSLVRETILQEA